MRKALLLLAACLSAFWAATVKERPVFSYIFTEAPRYEPHAWMSGADRFPSGAMLRYPNGSERRLVVTGFYASSDGAISFDGTRVLFSGKQTSTDRWQIWEVPLGRGTPRQVTAADSDCVRPLYLPEDQIVYTRITPAESWIESVPLAGGKPVRLTFVPGRYLTDDILQDGRILFEAGSERRELYTVYPDGSGVEALRCEHGPDRGDGRQVSSGDVVFSTATGLGRFTSSSAVQLDTLARASGPIAEVSPGEWIVRVGGGLLNRWADGRLSPLDVNRNAVEAVVVRPHTPPKRFPSGLVPTRTAGNLLCLNARLSRTPMSKDIATKVRVYTRDANRGDVMLGETAIESDGSFYIQVPADKPLRMELLGGTGGVIRSEHGWFWMRPSEQRVCVGCHAGPERSPENKVPQILLKTTTPVKMLEVSK